MQRTPTGPRIFNRNNAMSLQQMSRLVRMESCKNKGAENRESHAGSRGGMVDVCLLQCGMRIFMAPITLSVGDWVLLF